MGAEPQTQVSQADLTAAIHLIEKAAEDIRKIQLNLDMAGASLKSNWVGESHAAFNAVHIKWHERMDVILGSLRRLAASIQGSGKNYAEFNRERTEALNSIANLINQAPVTR
ncbi:WXG100 family type VII secretion target [Nonomuraea sp. NPDC050790]|uniref:WXG100 family type VII secretion target n=1 Tax=Nonomuraea sp. NPDC050790 TaxID=3364371 RepID=UPI0037BA9D2D